MNIFGGIKKDYAILIVVLTAVILALYVMFVIMPAFQNFKILGAQENKLVDEITSAERTVNTQEEIKAEISKMEQKIAAYEAMLPQNVDASQLFAYLVDMGKRHNISFVSLEPMPSKAMEIPGEKKQYIEFPLRLKVKATYHDFGRFVNSIETSERYMAVNDLSISPNLKDTKNHDISLTVVAVAMRKNQ